MPVASFKDSYKILARHDNSIGMILEPEYFDSEEANSELTKFSM